MTATGRAQLADMFNICNRTALDWVLNQADWAGNGVVYLPAQENDPSCTDPACNISGICQIMLDTTLGTPLQRLAHLSALQNGNECVEVDHNQVVAALTNTTIEGGTGRVWFYQTCTEFAFYQTCDPGTACPYTTGLNTLQYNLEQCVQAFNITGDTVYRRVNFSNAYWGSDNLQGSRILFPNGQIDPWHYLGVLTSPNDMEPVGMPAPACSLRTGSLCVCHYCLRCADAVGGRRVAPLLDSPVAAHRHACHRGGTQDHLEPSHGLAANRMMIGCRVAPLPPPCRGCPSAAADCFSCGGALIVPPLTPEQ